jgi:ABC-type cobalamin transport system permease subunit
MIEAWLVSITLMFAGIIVFIHSIFPFLFQTTGSRMVKSILYRTNKRQGADE